MSSASRVRQKTKAEEKKVNFPLCNANELPSSTNRALRIDLILENILSYLDFEEKKNCRLVSPSFSWSVCRLLSKEDSCCIIRLTVPRGTAFGPRYPCGFRYNLEKFIEVLEKSFNPSCFPCRSYSLSKIDLGSPSAKRFFTLVGHRIKTLELINDNNSAQSALKKVLNDSAPNVENLLVRGFYYENWPKEKEKNRNQKGQTHFSSLFLPHLKHLNLVLDTETRKREGSTIFEIVKAASNLLSIDGLHPALLEQFHSEFKEQGKLHLILKLTCLWSMYKNIEDVRAVCQIRLPNLKILDLTSCGFGPYSRKMTPLWNKVLELYGPHLEELELPFLSSMPQLNFPPMINLQKLSIREPHLYDPTPVTGQTATGTGRRRHSYFYLGMDLAHIFPNVHSLSLDDVHMCPDRYCSARPYNPIGHFPKVSHLEIYYCDPLPYNRKNIHRICPNVKSLKVLHTNFMGYCHTFPEQYPEDSRGINDDFHGAGNRTGAGSGKEPRSGTFITQICTQFRNLEKLEMIFTSSSNVDSAITGIPKNALPSIDQLEKQTFLENVASVMDKRRKCSIASIKGLKSLKMIFLDPSKKSHPVSKVSKFCTFDFLPHLKISTTLKKMPYSMAHDQGRRKLVSPSCYKYSA